MRTVLITGAARGLGLGLTGAMAARGSRVLAACRKPSEAQALNELAEKHSNIKVLKLDVLDVDLFDDFAREVSHIVEDTGLNLLINNAGVASKFTTLNYVKSEQIVSNYLVNTVGPIMLTKAFIPLLKQASQKNADSPMSINKAAVINMSSLLGSIAENETGGYYPYRCAKAALNAATKSMSIDLKKDNIIAISMHPGWVKTDMGGHNAPLDIQSSVDGMMNVLESLGGNDTGKFYQYDGKELAW